MPQVHLEWDTWYRGCERRVQKASPSLQFPRVSFRTVWGYLFLSSAFQHRLELFRILNLSCVGMNYFTKFSALHFLHPYGVITFLRLMASAIVQGFVS